MTKIGDRARCQRCGGKIVVISDPTIISLTAGLWVHVSALRRAFPTHAVVPPRG